MQGRLAWTWPVRGPSMPSIYLSHRHLRRPWVAGARVRHLEHGSARGALTQEFEQRCITRRAMPHLAARHLDTDQGMALPAGHPGLYGQRRPGATHRCPGAPLQGARGKRADTRERLRTSSRSIYATDAGPTVDERCG